MGEGHQTGQSILSKMSVKRSAPSSTIKQHPPKKRVVGKKSQFSARKHQLSSTPSNSRSKSRRKPVTAAEDVDEDEPNSSEAEDDCDDFPDVLKDEELVEEGDEEDAMDVEPENAPAKDPNGTLLITIIVALPCSNCYVLLYINMCH